jgi:hypothetical protein
MSNIIFANSIEQNTSRCCEAILSILDGVIVIVNILGDRDVGLSPHDVTTHGANMSPMLGAVFNKLRWDMSPTRKVKYDFAKTMAESSVVGQTPLKPLPQGVLGHRLHRDSAACSYVSLLNMSRMQRWLNYVLVYVEPKHQAYQVIGRCLRLQTYGNGDVRGVNWEHRQVHQIGTL